MISVNKLNVKTVDMLIRIPETRDLSFGLIYAYKICNRFNGLSYFAKVT